MKKIIDMLKNRQITALEALIEKESLPLVRDREVLFVYRDPDHSVRDVRLVHHISRLDRAPRFEQIPEFGLFFLHLVLPRCARMEYTFGIRYKSGREEIRTDPLNPEVAWCPFGPKSVVTTRGYRKPTWAGYRENIQRGRVIPHYLDSRIMGDRRIFSVYLPAAQTENGKYPLLMLHDGGDYKNFAGLIDILDNLNSDGMIEPFIAVLTEPGNRNEEYSCTPQHPAYLITELLPWINNKYPIDISRENIALMGCSFGAVASVYAAYHYPEVVGKLLIQSGSFVFQDVVRANGVFEPLDEFDRITLFLETEYFPDGPRKKLKVFQSCGTFEQILYYNQNFASEMKRLGHEIEYRESHDGHNWISWRDHLGDAFQFLFPVKVGEKVKKRRIRYA